MTSSLDALALFPAQPDVFDLIITDYAVPEMRCVDRAKQALKIRPDIPIIICTGYSESITKEQAKKYGIREFSMKPLKRWSIAEVMRKVVDEKQP